MKKQVYLGILLFFIVMKASSQTDFRPGYIITNQMDTIYGEIDYRGANRNAKRCDFRKEGSTDIEMYSPIEIYAYRYVNDKFYISKEIKIGEEKQRVFLEYLVDGIANLYYYRNKNKDYYFIEKENGQIYELTNEKKIINIGDASYLKPSNRHIGVLKLAFSDSENINSQLNKVKLGHESLIKITKKYHEFVCNEEECIVYEKNKLNSKVIVGPFINLNTSQFYFDPQSIDKWSDIQVFETDYQVSPSIGLILEFNLSKTNERFSVLFDSEFGLDNFKYNWSEEIDKTGVSYQTYKRFDYSMDLKAKYIKGSLLFKYSFPKGVFRPTLSVGAGLCRYMMFDFNVKKEYPDSPMAAYKEDFSSYVSNYFPYLKTGIGGDIYIKNKRKLFIRFSYERKVDRTFDRDIFMKIKTFSSSVGIYLN